MTDTNDVSKLTHLKKYDVILMFDNTTRETVRNEEGELPSDVHVVTYSEGGDTKFDAVRAYKQVDIFDGYYDRGLTILDIESGYGKIKPNLFNAQKEDKEKKEKKKSK